MFRGGGDKSSFAWKSFPQCAWPHAAESRSVGASAKQTKAGWFLKNAQNWRQTSKNSEWGAVGEPVGHEKPAERPDDQVTIWSEETSSLVDKKNGRNLRWEFSFQEVFSRGATEVWTRLICLTDSPRRALKVSLRACRRGGSNVAKQGRGLQGFHCRQCESQREDLRSA